jgi:hypothetical protein
MQKQHNVPVYVKEHLDALPPESHAMLVNPSTTGRPTTSARWAARRRSMRTLKSISTKRTNIKAKSSKRLA